MENNKNNISSHIDEMKRLVQEKAELLLKELTEDSLNDFKEKASTIAESIMEKYVFYVYDMFTTGEFAIKDLKLRNVFTNYRTGYQQKMLDWIEQNKPSIELNTEIPTKPLDKKWHYVTLGVGTAGAVGFEIGRRYMNGDRYWIGIAIEIITLVTSYLIYKNEKPILTKHIVKETISQLEKWIKIGESYSNELLTTFNL